MAISATLIRMLRFYIADLACDTQDWEDTELAQFLVLGGEQVAYEVNTEVTWTFNHDDPTITPDPLTKVVGLGNLMVLKTGCMITLSEMRKFAAQNGIRIRDDITEIDTRDAGKVRKETYLEYCSNYEKARWEWEKGNKSSGRAIFGSFSSADGALRTADKRQEAHDFNRLIN